MGVPVPVPFYVKAALFVKAFLAANWFKIALVAGQYAYQRHQRKKLEKLANQGLAASYSGSVDYSSIVFGERMLEHGTRVWSNSGPKSPYVVEVIALMNQGRGGIEGITKVFLDEEEYAFPDDFEKLSRPGTGERDQSWWRPKQVNSEENGNRWNKGDNFLFRFHLGDQTIADAAIAAGSETGNAAYAATNIGKGIVYVIPAYKNNVNVLGHGIPDTRWQIKGYKCYDPRVAGASFSETNKWIWSDNPVVQAAFVQTEFINGGSDERVDWDRVREFAEYCDEEVEFNPYSDDENHRHEGVHVISQIPTEDGASYDATPSIVSGSRMRDPDQTGAGAQTRYIDDRLASFTPAPGDGDLEDDWLSDGTGEIVKVTLMAESLDMTLVLTTDKLTSDKLGYMRLKFERTIGSPSQDYTIDVPILSWGDPVESTDNGGPAGAERTIYTYTPKHKEIIQQRNLLGNYRALDNEFFHDMVRTNPAKVKVTLYVPSPSALEKRYRSDIVLPGNSSPADFFEQLALSCDGNYLRYQDNGKWALEPSSPGSSTLEIKEANLGQYPAFVSHDELSERFTEIAGAYVDRKKGWKRTETPPLKSPSLRQRERTDLPRQEVAYDAVVRFSQVWRLLYRQTARQEMQETISLGMYWDGLELIYGTRFDFKSEMLSIDALKKFRVERVSLTSEDVPIVVEAREDADWIYDPVGWEEYPYYTEDDALVVPAAEGPPLGSLTATGELRAIRLDWTAPAFGGIGNVEIWDSDTASFADAAKRPERPGEGTTTISIDYEPWIKKYFWAYNIVGDTRSSRFGDDISSVHATAFELIVTEEFYGECPPENLWALWTRWKQPSTGEEWFGAPDFWTNDDPKYDRAFNDATLLANGRIRYNVLGGAASSLDLTAGTGNANVSLIPRVPIEDINNTLIVVRGDASGQLRPGVLFHRVGTLARIGTFNAFSLPANVAQMPPEIFSDSVGAPRFNSIDVNTLAGSEAAGITFADDDNPQRAPPYSPGPHLAKDAGKYTIVLKVGSTVYAMPLVTPDTEEPYTLVRPTGFDAAMKTLHAGTNMPTVDIALIDEDLWTGGTSWNLAFSETVARAVFATPAKNAAQTGGNWMWERVGTAPNFSGANLQVAQLKQDERCYRTDFVSKWQMILQPSVPRTARPGGGDTFCREIPAGKIGQTVSLPTSPTHTPVSERDAIGAGHAWIKTYRDADGTDVTEAAPKALVRIHRLWFSLKADENEDEETTLETIRYLESISSRDSIMLFFEDEPNAWVAARLEQRFDMMGGEISAIPIDQPKGFASVNVVELADDRDAIMTSPQYPLSALVEVPAVTHRKLFFRFSRAKDGKQGADADGFITNMRYVITP